MSPRRMVCVLAGTLILALGACATGETDSDRSGSSAGSDSAATAALPTTSHPDTSDWNRLFRADLSDAVLDSPDSWTFERGVLAANDHTTIWSDEAYGDFVLDFEARIPDGSNSGVFFRTANPDSILSALELQMYDPPGDNGEADERHQYGGRNGAAALYDLRGPSGGTLKPTGEWNRFTITAKDSMIYVVLNGEPIHEMNLMRWTEPGRTPEGEAHKFERALKNQAKSGPIGLQGIHSANGVSVEYRNLKVRRLTRQ